MKKLNLNIFFIMIALILGSCSKEETQENLVPATNATDISTLKETNEPSYAEYGKSEEPIVDDILFVINNWGDYPGIVHFWLNPEGQVEIDLPEHPPYETFKIICEGNGLSFARCVRDYLKKNPGDKVDVWYDASTEKFYADNNECS